ncbi:MAG: MGMT family protein [Cyanobacteria bacterium J06638_38]
MSMTQAEVKNLFRKQEHKASMLVTERLRLLSGFGIDGDLNSDDMSPRQVLLTSTQDLNQLSILPGEMRENIVLDTSSDQGFRPGAKLTFTSGAVIRLTFYCEPCKRLSHLANSISDLEQKRGILGVIITGGAIALGDKVSIESDYFPALSEEPYERFLNYVAQIPRGKVVTYKQILRCIGVDRSYFRVMPVYIKKAPANYPLHRILDSQGKITPHIPHQLEQLKAEGITISRDSNHHRVSLEQYVWEKSSIY